jgi:hypothetical protein
MFVAAEAPVAFDNGTDLQWGGVGQYAIPLDPTSFTIVGGQITVLRAGLYELIYGFDAQQGQQGDPSPEQIVTVWTLDAVQLPSTHSDWDFRAVATLVQIAAGQVLAFRNVGAGVILHNNDTLQAFVTLKRIASP